MVRLRILLRALFFGLLFAFCLGVGCEATVAPAKGELILVVSTDMQVPDDIDRMRIEVRTRGEPLLENDYDLGLGGVALPATLGLVDGAETALPIRINVVSFKSGEPKTLRKVITTVPEDRIVVLRVRMEAACVGQVELVNGEYVDLKCEGEDQTCINGECVSASVDSSTLPDHVPGDLYTDDDAGKPDAASDGGVPAACEGTTADCNGEASDGCEVDLGSDPLHCGACATVCSNEGGIASCTASKCKIACNAGRANCDGALGNGCEVDTTADPQNCGGCGLACSSIDGTASCASSTCAIVCDAGFEDCNASVADGCETNTASDPANCDGCGAACPTIGGTPTCTGGVCGYSPCPCSGTMASCDGTCENDCETDTSSSAEHCGFCGNACDSTNGTASCAAGACAITCSAGFGDCDGQAGNGCETSLTTGMDCGACGTTCDYTNGTAFCSGGACGITCNPGWGDCDGLASNGCEADLASNPLTCGGCSSVCSPDNGTASCVAGTCSFTCDAGWDDCDGLDSNGCETDLQSDPQSCGSCGAACGSTNATAACTAGACALVCNAGFGDCDGIVENGCETPLVADPLNCGACGRDCLGAACAGSACEVVPLATAQSQAWGVALDADYVYWTTWTLGEVRRAPLAGGPSTLLATGGNKVCGIAVDSANVYYRTSAAIMKVPVGGGAPTLLASANGTYSNIATEGTHVYYPDGWGGSGRIAKVPTAGGAVQTALAGQSAAWGVAVDANNVYCANWATSADIAFGPLAGGAATVLASAQPNSMFVATDGTTVFWMNAGKFANTAELRSAPVTGGTSVALASGLSLTTAGGSSGHGVAVDATHVYFTVDGDGTVRKVPIGGGAVTTIASGQPNPTMIALDAVAVYWTNQGSSAAGYTDGGVVRLAK